MERTVIKGIGCAVTSELLHHRPLKEAPQDFRLVCRPYSLQCACPILCPGDCCSCASHWIHFFNFKELKKIHCILLGLFIENDLLFSLWLF